MLATALLPLDSTHVARLSHIGLWRSVWAALGSEAQASHGGWRPMLRLVHRTRTGYATVMAAIKVLQGVS